jgi:hypothetical protein
VTDAQANKGRTAGGDTMGGGGACGARSNAAARQQLRSAGRAKSISHSETKPFFGVAFEVA